MQWSGVSFIRKKNSKSKFILQSLVLLPPAKAMVVRVESLNRSDTKISEELNLVNLVGFCSVICRV